MKKNKHHRHRPTFVLLIGLLFIVVFISVICLYLYFHNNDGNSRSATILFSYSEQSSELKVDNSMPITDAIGKQLTFSADQTKYSYSEFSISSNMVGLSSVNYEIYAKVKEGENTIPSDYVKVYLTDGKRDLPLEGYNDKSVPTFQDLKVASSDAGGRRLYSGTLKKDEVKKFKLRMWLRDTYPITTELRDFDISLYVKTID